MKKEIFERAKKIENEKHELLARIDSLDYVLENFNTSNYWITIQEDGSERYKDFSFDRKDIIALKEIMQHRIDSLDKEFETL